MGLGRFLFLTVLGGGIWTSALGTAGYVLGQKSNEIDRYLGPASTAIMAVILVIYLYRVVRFPKA